MTVQVTDETIMRHIPNSYTELPSYIINPQQKELHDSKTISTRTNQSHIGMKQSRCNLHNCISIDFLTTI